MLFAEVVACSTAVGATRARTAKAAALAGLLRAAGPEEIEPATAWLTGEPRQGRLGAGWRTLAGLRVPSAGTPTLQVADVEAGLEALAATSGPGSTARRAAQLDALFGAATADEQRFLQRLLTGELRQGALEGVMLEAVAAAADVPAATVRRAFFLSGQLPKTARTALTGGVAALEAVTPEVGRPVRPMLASPAESLDAALADLGAGVAVEFKLDGARVQVHRDGDEVRVWTRTLKEITDRVPELVALVRGLPCRSVVLDGESLALHDDGRPRPFQETASRFGADAHELLLRPFFFDCLHLDGADLIDEPLSVRLEALEKVAGTHRIRSVLDRPPPGVRAARRGAGGRPRGRHGQGARQPVRGGAARARRGRRSSRCTRWTWSCWAPSGVTGGARGCAVEHPPRRPRPRRGRAGHGRQDLQGHDRRAAGVADRDVPAVHPRGARPRGRLLRPELVVEIELDGVQRSTRYPGGVALRFARVVRYRPDKTAAEADTIDAVRALLPRGPAE